MIRAAFVSSLLVGLSAAAAAVAQDLVPKALPSVALPAELARVLTGYEAAWRARDAAALAALFDPDGFVFSNGSPPVRGRAAIEAHYEGAGGPLYLRAFAYAAEGKIAYILGGFTHQAGQPDDGKYTLTLRRAADGRWLIASDMDNGNTRAR